MIRSRLFALRALAFVTAALFCTSSRGDDLANAQRNEHTALLDRLSDLQTRFYDLALAFDQVVVDGLQRYPVADWEVRDPAVREKAYDELMRFAPMSKADPAFAARVNGTRYNYPFDVLRLWTGSSANVSTDTVRALNQGELQLDPFAPGDFLRYVAAPADYILVSVGPDRKPDLSLAGIDTWGQYGSSPTASRDAIASATAQSRMFVRDPNDWTVQITLDPDKLYDPTNGLLSPGDIVFHKRGGDDWMFSFEAGKSLNRSNLIKKDLKQTLHEIPARMPPNTSMRADKDRQRVP